MRGLLFVALLGAALGLSRLGCDRPRSDGQLPLDRLTLYAAGLGYYERAGTVAKDAVAEIPLEPGQLDDALKTAVVLSEDGVASIEYDPPIPLEAARAEAGLPSDTETHDLATLLAALRGYSVRVEREGRSALDGRLIDVERGSTTGDPSGARDGATRALLMFGPSGLVRVPVETVAAVVPLETSVSLAWDRAARAQSARPRRPSLRIRGGSRGGRVAVGYTTEAPVWRTTYRLIAGESPARLQGFALVHNNSDEDWRGVTITLVSGRPSSFIFPLASPRYGRRELVAPEDGLEVSPQLITAEARGHLEGSAIGDSFGLGIAGTSGAGGGGFGYGAGGLGRAIERTGSAAPSDLLLEGPSPLVPAAVSEAGDLFLYTVLEPVHLPARKSALLPIIDTRIDAEPVTIVDDSGTAEHGVRIHNKTNLTLEAGVVAVYADHAFQGEARIDRFKPGEVRVVRHGEDLDVQAVLSEDHLPGPARVVRRTGGGVTVHRVDRLVHRLELTSRSDRTRTLLVELASEGYRIVEGAEEDVRSPGQPRYGRLLVEPRQHLKTVLVEEGAIAASFDLFDLKGIDRLLRSEVLEDESRSTLLRARAEVSRGADALERAALAKHRLDEAERDVVRIRESVAAAGRSSAHSATEALAAKLLRSEDQLERLRSEHEGAVKTAEHARKAAVDALE